MRVVYLLFIYTELFTSTALSSVNEEISELVYVSVSDDKSACRHSVPVAVTAPKSINGHEFEFAMVIMEEGERYFESSLQYIDDLGDGGGVFFCIDELSIANVRIVLGYGYDDCEGSIYSFYFDGLDKILVGNNERVYSDN